MLKTIQDELDKFSRSHFLYEGQAYQAFLQAALSMVDSDFGYFHLYDSATQELHLTVWSSAVLQNCTTSHDGHYPVSKAGIWADSIRRKETVVHNDYEALTEKKGLPQGHFRLYRHISTPIIINGKIVGVVGAGNREAPYTESDIEYLETFTRKCFPILQERAESIAKRRIAQSIQLKNGDAKDILIGMVSTLIQASALRDEYTAFHESRVSELAVAIGKKLELSNHELLGLRLGGLVHDIGKMAVPSEILNKIGEIKPVEMNLIRIHPEMGAKIFSSLQTPWPLAQMIEQHHERMDGTGYPYGLRSEQIAMEARIIAVADVFDSMSTDRPYRFAPGQSAAIEELRSGRGVRYDPYAVDAFLEHWQLEITKRELRISA